MTGPPTIVMRKHVRATATKRQLMARHKTNTFLARDPNAKSREILVPEILRKQVGVVIREKRVHGADIINGFNAINLMSIFVCLPLHLLRYYYIHDV